MKHICPSAPLRRLLVAVVIAALAGCITTQRVAPDLGVRLTVTPAGTIEFLGRTVPVDGLDKILRKSGVQPGQEIRVHLNDPHDTQMLQRITGILATGGFRRVIFTTPRHAEAFVPSEASPNRPSAPPAP